MKKWARLLLGAALVTTCATTQAAIQCDGLVNYALLYSDGTVNIQGAWRGEFTLLCNTNGSWGIPAEVCLSWYAVAAKAAADGKVLTVYYNTDSYSCANLPVYGSSLMPVYVGVKRQ